MPQRRSPRSLLGLRDLPIYLLLGAIATAALYLPTWRGLLSGPELVAEDALLRIRDGWRRTEPGAPVRVCVVRITERDLQRFGHPVPDGVLAQAIERILAAQPRGVGIDLFRDLPAGAGRERLASLAASHEEIVFAESLPSWDRASIPAPDFVERPSQRGFGDALRDGDGRVRRILLKAWTADGTEHASLALQLADLWLAGEPGARHAIPERLRSGDPAYGPFDDRGYQIRANFSHGRQPYHTTELGVLLDGGADEALFRDRVVLVGSAAVSLGDLFLDPTSEDGRAGVEIHALAVDQALRFALEGEAAPSPLPGPVSWSAIFALAILGAAFGLHAHSWSRSVGFALAMLAMPAALALLVLAADRRGPVVTATASIVVAATLGGVERLRRERRDRLVIDRLLESHVSGGVRDILWQERHHFLREGRLPARHVTATILFADLVASAEVAEFTAPPEYLRWLEDCMGALAGAVGTHGGLVEDYWGDGLKASFGALLPQGSREDVARDARAAVEAALAMDAALAGLNTRWASRGLGRARMRIGLHTGPVVVGSIGGLRRHKFTSVGDTITVAARLEAFLREDPEAVAPAGDAAATQLTRILASEETVACLGGLYRTVLIGEERLRGRQAKVCIHRILGPAMPPGRDILPEITETTP